MRAFGPAPPCGGCAGSRSAPVIKPPIWLLVAMTGLGPFTMQILMPCLPALATALAVSYATAQLTLSIYLIGVAFGQLLYGPLSDRFGRKPLLSVGLVFYLAGSALAVVAPSAWVLVVARVMQALGGCAGLVLGRAMIRDAWSREQSASVMGIVSTAMSVAPMVAPLLGSLLEEWFGWRATMAACLAFGLPLLLAVHWRLPETLAQRVDMPGLEGFIRAHVALLRVPAFRGYCAITACTTSIFFAFAAGAPRVVVEGLGHAATSFAMALMVISVAWSAGAFTTARLAARIGTMRLLHWGVGIGTGGAVLAVLFPLLLPANLVLFFLPMVLVAYGNGITQPNAIAAAVSVRPTLAGTASGLVGSAQMAAGAVMTVIAGSLEDGGGLATAFCMLVPAIGTQFALAYARRAAA